jgi:hypothetical protein
VGKEIERGDSVEAAAAPEDEAAPILESTAKPT